MAVPIRVITLAEDSPVLLGRECRIVVAMRRGKLDLACHMNHRLMTGEQAWLPDTPALSTLFCLARIPNRSEEHTSELQSRGHLVCRLLLEKKKKITQHTK